MKTMKKQNLEKKIMCFERFGNTFSGYLQALAELFWNAIGAGKATRIYVDYVNNHIYVSNDGQSTSVNEVFQYGESTSDSPLSQFGTGLVSSAACLNPSNNDFIFITKNEDGIPEYVKAPFDALMESGTCDVVSDFHDDVVTSFCVLDEHNKFNEENVIRYISLHYDSLIKEGFLFYVNGKKVNPISIEDGCLSDVRTKDITINNKPVKIKITTLNVIDEGTEYYPKSDDWEGVFIKYHGILICHLGLLAIHATNKKTCLRKHPSMNGYRDIIDIIDPDFQPPFTNNKTCIRNDVNETKELFQAIDELVGDRYRQKNNERLEKHKRKACDYVCKKFLNSTQKFSKLFYRTEYKLNKEMQADGVIFYNSEGNDEISTELIANGTCKIITIIEYKKSGVGFSAIAQAVAYCLSISSVSVDYYRPAILLVGDKITAEAKNLIKEYKNLGIDCDFMRYDFFVEE